MSVEGALNNDYGTFDEIDGKLIRMVRGSEVTDFQRCRMRWNLRWNKGYNVIKADGKLWAGNLFHKYMEIWFSTKDSVAAMAAMQDMYDKSPDQSFEATEILDLVAEITENYMKQWNEKDAKMTVMCTEFTFAVPITNELYYTGTIDKLLHDENMFMHFSDYKLTNSIDKYRKKAAMDQQISRYWWALEVLAAGQGYVQVTEQTTKTNEFGIVVEVDQKVWMPVSVWSAMTDIFLSSPHGFIYDVVLREMPKPPEPLKAGGLSVNKAAKTTYDLYLQELIKMELAGYDFGGILWVDGKYTDILAHLKAQETDFGNRFFQRFPVTRNIEELQIAMSEFYATASEMWAVEKRAKFHEEFNAVGAEHNPIYRHNTDDCNWDCQFLEYCAASMKGADADYLLNIGYTKEDTKNYAKSTDFPS